MKTKMINLATIVVTFYLNKKVACDDCLTLTFFHWRYHPDSRTHDEKFPRVQIVGIVDVLK